MEHQPEVETNPNDVTEGADIKVYVTVSSLTTESVNRLLENESMPDTELFDIEHLNGYTAQQICNHHRENQPLGSDANSQVFILFDSDQPEKRGVLVVTLCADYHQLPDAVRQLPSYAAMCAGSLSIGNSEWQLERKAAFDNSQEGQEPIPRFALYNLLPEGERDSFNAAAQAIDEGIHNIDGSAPDGDDATPSQQDPGEVLERYHLVTPNDKDIDAILTWHRQVAADLGLEVNHFAAVDDQREKEGTLLIQIEPKDQFRCRGPSDGELLWWIAIGFMTWDDAKVFASNPPFIED